MRGESLEGFRPSQRGAFRRADRQGTQGMPGGVQGPPPTTQSPTPLPSCSPRVRPSLLSSLLFPLPLPAGTWQLPDSIVWLAHLAKWRSVLRRTK